MKTYMDKLQELGIEALDESREEIKKAIIASQIEVISKVPQYLDKLIEVLANSGDDNGA